MGRGQDLDALGFGAAADDVESAEEFLAILRVEGFVDEDFVFLFDLVAGMGEGEGEIPVIADQEEAFAFLVETADMVEARPIRGEKIEDGLAAAFVAGAADVAGRLVQDDGDLLFGLEEAIPDFDGVIGADLGGEVGDDAPVDADLAGGDELFDTAAGAEAGGGEETVQAHVRKGRMTNLDDERRST